MEASIIVFSQRKNGNSDYVARIVSNILDEKGVRSNVIFSRNLKLVPCNGCMRCIFKHPGKCQFDDDLEVYLEVLKSEYLFLISPVYFLTPVSDWKLLQDKILTFQPYMGQLKGNCGVFLTAGLPDWSISDHLMSILSLTSGHRVSGVETLYGPGPGHVLIREENIEKIKKVTTAVVEGKYLPKEECCNICYHPYLKKEDSLYCPVCDAYADSNGMVKFEQCRWHPERLAKHYKEWVYATGEMFKKDLPTIRRKVQKMGLLKKESSE